MHIIILFGAPGSGKGSQSKCISKSLKFPILSTGNLAREQVNLKTDLGKVIAPYMSEGKLIPDQIIMDLFYKAFNSSDKNNGIILDGFPRTLKQAEALDSLLNTYFIGKNKLSIFYLDVPLDVIVKRISGRKICTSCGSVFNIDSAPPKEVGVCDECGSQLEVRLDDTELIITKRFKEYENLTRPLKDYYSERVIMLNGLSHQDEIASLILTEINNG